MKIFDLSGGGNLFFGLGPPNLLGILGRDGLTLRVGGGSLFSKVLSEGLLIGLPELILFMSDSTNAKCDTLYYSYLYLFLCRKYQLALFLELFFRHQQS